MDAEPPYRRAIVKVSGQALSGPDGGGIEPDAVRTLLEEIAAAAESGVELCVVVGGGNFLRGREFAPELGIQRATADSMGMLATVINALALRDCMTRRGIEARVMSAIPMERVCKSFNRDAALHHLGKGRIVLLAAGTGSPMVTTDMCAAMRGAELDADVLMKATKVDGVFDSDPAENPDARKYEKLTFQQVLADRLGVMDLTAVSMCMEHHLPVLVFQITRPGNLARALRGQTVGTLLTET